MAVQYFRHGNAQVAVTIEDGVVHFETKLLTLSPVVRLDIADTAEQVEQGVRDALDEAIDAAADDVRAALKAAMDWAEEHFGVGQLA